jgi:hypothetical protein
MEIAALLDQIQADGTLHRIATDPAVQFGTGTRRYIGAEILPERQVTVNMFRETKVSYRTVLANHGDRYSPAQKKNGKFVGHFDVILSDSDIADEFTGAEYDALIQLITPLTGPIDAAVQGMAAVGQLNRWMDKGINLPMVELNEKMRWQALVNKQVNLRGDNGYKEDINYPKFADLTITAQNWTDDTIDPWDDVFAIMQAFALRGVTIRRIVAGLQVVQIMAKNAKVRARAGHITVLNGEVTSNLGFATLAQMNQALTSDGLPAIETYDLQYRTQTGSGYFLPRDVMVFVGTSDNEEAIDLGDGQFETIEGTLGYLAVGRGVGQSAPGRRLRMEAFDDKPPRVTGQGWQSSLPVITEPELIGIIKGIKKPGTNPG